MAIIAKLQGGLGNQMFQYALGRRLSLLKNTDLRLDIEGLSRDPLRSYSLDAFDIKASIASPQEVERLKKFKRTSGGILSSVRNLFFARPKIYIQERRFHFDPDVLATEKDAYLDGYWNTEKYFKDIRPELLRDFRLKNPISGKNKEAADQITKENSVSIHVRRGDYASNPHTNIVHGTLGADYYANAIKIISDKIPHPKFFVFSDDMPWVKANLKLPSNTEYVDWNGPDKAAEDIRLISLCKHHIIANSTFSWWGAWLSENPDKIVIGPARWFNTKKQSTYTSDVLPEAWIKI